MALAARDKCYTHFSGGLCYGCSYHNTDEVLRLVFRFPMCHTFLDSKMKPSFTQSKGNALSNICVEQRVSFKIGQKVLQVKIVRHVIGQEQKQLNQHINCHTGFM